MPVIVIEPPSPKSRSSFAELYSPRRVITGGYSGIGKVATFGSDVPLKRAGQWEEVAPCYVFLASQNASYMTGQVLHPNGGTVVNG